MALSRHHHSPPVWEVVELVANKLDPKTLAIASCVSKSWLSSMSANHLWQPLCAQFPTISTLYPTVSYRRIYALGYTSSQRRLKAPPKPRLSLDNLLLSITLPRAKTIVKACNELERDPTGVFRFNFDVKDEEVGGFLVDYNDDEDMKITCNLILKGYGGVLTVLDGKGKGKAERWFTEELPSPGCCFGGGGTSGMVSEINLVVCGKKLKVSFGVMNVSSWRYAGVDDTLRYLQHFLLPNNTSHVF